MDDKVKIVMSKDVDHEDLFFKEQEKKLIQQLREKAAKEADKKYREEHKGHCFRCGTKSLAEVTRENVTIDICINEGCGAIHLDPGELEMFQQSAADSAGAVAKISKAVFSIFK